MSLFKGSRSVLIAVATAAFCLGLSSTAVADDAETADDKIARAMTAAPTAISAKAAIMDVDGTILREGSNGWTCLPGVGLIPGDQHPMCNDEVWMNWMQAMGAGEEFSTDVVGYSYMLAGDALVNNNDPGATDPKDGGVWVQEGPHLMLLLPTSMSLENINHDPFAGGPYVMWGGTPMEHIMVPAGDNTQ